MVALVVPHPLVVIPLAVVVVEQADMGQLLTPVALRLPIHLLSQVEMVVQVVVVITVADRAALEE
jgi:hypothetical protein